MTTENLNFLNTLWIDYIIPLIFNLILCLGILISVAFYTLAERKIMAAVQRRKGPNIAGIGGVLQPLLDGLKLELKEIVVPTRAYPKLFFGAALLSFTVAFTSWSFLPLSTVTLHSGSNISLLVLFALSSLAIYGIVIGGWSSNSKYAFLGALRSTAQMISYEIIIGTIIFIFAIITGSLNLTDIVMAQKAIPFAIPLWPIMIIFFIAALAETNRAPFDLPEAEAEIVAGYNVEYSGIVFAFFFLGEYSSMLLFSTLIVLLFLGGWYFSSIIFIFNILIIASSMVLVRASLPRLRFDQLMIKSWTILLPITFGAAILVAFIASVF